MGADIWIRLLLILIGLVILGVTTMSLAKKHMTESFCVFWGLVSILFIVAGILLRPREWNLYMSWQTLVLAFLGVISLLIAGFYFSVRISRLIRQVTELAIQVSLLNQENEILSGRYNAQEADIDEGHKHEEDDLIYN